MKIIKSDKGVLSCDNPKVDRIVNYGGGSAIKDTPFIEYVTIYFKDGSEKSFSESYVLGLPTEKLIEQAEKYLDTV